MRRLSLRRDMNNSLYIMEAIKRASEFNSIIPKRITDIYNLACNYYGKKRVQLCTGFDCFSYKMCKGNSWIPRIFYTFNYDEDLDNITELKVFTILIHFPEVTITNELNQSTTIYDLFVRVPIKKNGTLSSGIQFFKATYKQSELRSGYLHSHCHVQSSDSLRRMTWDSPCLGTGPLKNTQARLCMENTNEDSNNIDWTAFFWELDKVVHVESLDGIPYIKMSSIGITEKYFAEEIYSYNSIRRYNTQIKQFIESYLKTDRMKFSVVNNKIALGEPYEEWLVGLTEYFYKWINSNPNLSEYANMLMVKEFTEYMLKPYAINNNKIYVLKQSANELLFNDNEFVLNFNGKDFYYNTIEDDDYKKTYLIDYKIAGYILSQILNYLNCFYGAEKFKSNSGYYIIQSKN